MQGLIRAALTNNYDLRVAVARVEESRALLAQSRSQFYPQLAYLAGLAPGRNVLGKRPITAALPPARAATGRWRLLGN